MSSVIEDRDEFINLAEAPSTTDNWRHTKANYGISQHRTIVEVK